MDTEHNPFAPPQAEMQPLGIVTGFEDDTESIRRRFLNHESAIRYIGWLYLIGAAIMFLGVLSAASMLFGADGRSAEIRSDPERAAFFTYAFVMMALFVVVPLLIGVGLVRLSNVARIAGIVLGALLLLTITVQLIVGAAAPMHLIVFLVQGVFLYYLTTRRGSYVCSAEYRQIVHQTPHVRRRSWVMIVLALLVAFFVLSGIFFVFLPRFVH